MKRDFEKYFPLPLSNGFSKFIAANGDTLDVNILADRHDEFMNYIVQCANLMPEAVEIIKLACFSPCRDLCKYAKNGAPSVDVPECDYCPEGAHYERAKAFLAKLEGGETV